ncbi:MAG: class I SAM-dependent methyltransferase [Bauldia sp.]|nr:class I SAM-dependent methyltransferase [Bauldia sp.]
MLEKVQDPRYAAIAKPAEQVLGLLRRLLLTNDSPTVCEVGIGIGATSVEICRLLDHKGIIFFFDFAEKLEQLGKDLSDLGFQNFVMVGNERKTFDSYAWNLGKLLLDNIRAGKNGLFDLVFLDGAHAFQYDAPAAVILKGLVKPGGVLILDDYDWSFAVSPTMRPSVKPEITNDYTHEQIEMSHVKFVCDLFFDPDPLFEKIDIGYGSKEHRRAYRRLG